MEVVIRETKRTVGKQSLLKDNKQFFLLTSIKTSIVNKTFIVKCDENCNVKNWNEVFTMIPSNHDTVLEMLENDMLTTKDFNFIEL